MATRATGKKCTPGVYILVGERGFRVGQSRCMETRVAVTTRGHQECLGKIKRIIQVPVLNPKQRLQLEKDLIEGLKATSSCNVRRC